MELSSLEYEDHLQNHHSEEVYKMKNRFKISRKELRKYTRSAVQKF